MKQIQTSHMIPALCMIMLLGLSEFAGSFVSSNCMIPEHSEKCELIDPPELTEEVQAISESNESTLLFGTALYTEDWDTSYQEALAEAYIENKEDMIYFYESMDDIMDTNDRIEIENILEIFDIPVDEYSFSIKEY